MIKDSYAIVGAYKKNSCVPFTKLSTMVTTSVAKVQNHNQDTSTGIIRGFHQISPRIFFHFRFSRILCELISVFSIFFYFSYFLWCAYFLLRGISIGNKMSWNELGLQAHFSNWKSTIESLSNVVAIRWWLQYEYSV